VQIRSDLENQHHKQMKTTITSLACLTVIAACTVTADAAKPKKKKEFTPPPTATPAGAPSADLGRFISTNLDKILGPLDPTIQMPKAELTQLRASFSARFAKASLAERTQYQAAIAVCDALSQAMTERGSATSQAAWTQRSAQLRANIQQLMDREKAAESGAAPAH
jgi:hypothetical protein